MLVRWPSQVKNPIVFLKELEHGQCVWGLGRDQEMEIRSRLPWWLGTYQQGLEDAACICSLVLVATEATQGRE